MSEDGNKEIKPMNIATLDYFLDWLGQNKDLSREDMRTALMYSFLPPDVRNLGYFHSERERFLRREVVDTFINGGDVDMKDLREAVYYLCVSISEAGDAVASARRKEERRREPFKKISRRALGA